MKTKVLNLYAGIVGNRKLWEGVEVTAVEYQQDIADVYANNFPDDRVICGDAHDYLLKNYTKYDFIWASPPCPTHSKFTRSGRNRTPQYPDMKLYQEIIFLKHNFKGQWVVENVIPYYEPLIRGRKVGRHMLWSNFEIANIKVPKMHSFMTADIDELKDYLGIHFEGNIYCGKNHDPGQVLRNCVHPKLGLHILKESKRQGLFTLNQITDL